MQEDVPGCPVPEFDPSRVAAAVGALRHGDSVFEMKGDARWHRPLVLYGRLLAGDWRGRGNGNEDDEPVHRRRVKASPESTIRRFPRRSGRDPVKGGQASGEAASGAARVPAHRRSLRRGPR